MLWYAFFYLIFKWHGVKRRNGAKSLRIQVLESTWRKRSLMKLLFINDFVPLKSQYLFFLFLAWKSSHLIFVRPSQLHCSNFLPLSSVYVAWPLRCHGGLANPVFSLRICCSSSWLMHLSCWVIALPLWLLLFLTYQKKKNCCYSCSSLTSMFCT